MHEEQLKQMKIEKEELIRTAPDRVKVLQTKLGFDEDYAGCLLGFVNNIPLLEDGVQYDWEVPASINEEDMICIDCKHKHHRVELIEHFMNLEWSLSRCNQCYEVWKKERTRAMDEKQVNRRIEKCGIPKRSLDADIENLPEGRRVRLLGANLENHLWLVGPNRTGKTYAAVALLKEKAKEGGIKMIMFSHLFHPDINQSLGVFKMVTTWTGVLLVDDVAPNISEYWTSKLDDLVKTRYDEMLPTIFTSNTREDMLENVFGPRVYSRMVESGQVLSFKELKTKSSVSEK